MLSNSSFGLGLWFDFLEQEFFFLPSLGGDRFVILISVLSHYYHISLIGMVDTILGDVDGLLRII